MIYFLFLLLVWERMGATDRDSRKTKEIFVFSDTLVFETLLISTVQYI